MTLDEFNASVNSFVFPEDGHLWHVGDVITAQKLNVMESNLHASDSSYEIRMWEDGDVVDAEKLNDMELGLSHPTREWTNGDVMTVENLNALSDEIFNQLSPISDAK